MGDCDLKIFAPDVSLYVFQAELFTIQKVVSCLGQMVQLRVCIISPIITQH